MNWRLIVIKTLGLLILLGILLCVYWFAIRPGQLHWGATLEEIASSLPGDGLVPNPTFKATRAITINGTPEEIWPWLVQMGYGRAGFYGYDLLENLGSPTGIRSADHIVPELQKLAVGDPLPIFPGATMQVQALDRNRAFVWVGGPSYSSMNFTWVLIPLDAHHTRLISRVQFRHVWNNLFQAGQIAFTEFLDHLAIRKILLGIKGRVEGYQEPITIQIGEITTFVIGLLEFLAATFLFLIRKEWQQTWGFALLTGMVFTLAVYAHAPYWFSALLELFILLGFNAFLSNNLPTHLGKDIRWKTG